MTARARCADFLDVVDAAFKRPGGPAQQRMETIICPACPIWDECLRTALATGEHGPWGGTNERQRRKVTHHGSTFNLRGVHVDEPIGCAVNMRRMQELGITSAQVKAWAGRTGGGTPSLALIDVYVQAHESAPA